MATENVWIKSVRFRDCDGKPTCIWDLAEGECCDYLNSRNECERLDCKKPRGFKTSEGWGGLKPLKDCPFWQEENEVAK